ncbi:MAG: hypothetical protein ACLFVJ_14520 [Persicimonas sp.]
MTERVRHITLASLFAAIAACALLAACSSVGETCQFDSDCSGGNLCVQGTCYAPCSTGEDCESPYDNCHAHSRPASDGQQTVRVCVTDEFEEQQQANEDCESVGDCCESDAECAEAFDDDAYVCGLDDRCILPVVTSHAVLIRDISDPNEPADDDGPGADIAAAFVSRSGAADPVGYASWLEYSPADGAEAPESVLEAAFDGTAPDLRADNECVDAAFADHAVPLGRGGELLLGFDDEDGAPLRLNTNWRLVVIEWGENCGVTEARERFEVWLCEAEHTASTEASDHMIDAHTDCNRRLTPDGAAGYAIIPLDAE